ncbi:Armadillo repeat-containing protein 7 [Blattella germanica]|nr:Armadillo repeat-containing protein 7 [Blattella germanica]
MLTLGRLKNIENKEYILHCNGVQLISSCLSSPNEETVLSAITTLMYLVTPESKQEITSPPILDCMLQFSLSQNARLKNLTTIFLDDYCTPEQVEAAKQSQSQPLTVANIPLPTN